MRIWRRGYGAAGREISPRSLIRSSIFDERDLLGWVEEAGFEAIHMAYEIEICPEPGWPYDWDSFVRSSGNPLDPTLEEAMAEGLSRPSGTAS